MVEEELFLKCSNPNPASGACEHDVMPGSGALLLQMGFQLDWHSMAEVYHRHQNSTSSSEAEIVVILSQSPFVFSLEDAEAMYCGAVVLMAWRSCGRVLGQVSHRELALLCRAGWLCPAAVTSSPWEHVCVQCWGSHCAAWHPGLHSASIFRCFKVVVN